MMVAQYMNIALPDLLLWAHISRLSGAQCMTFVGGYADSQQRPGGHRECA